MIAVSQLRGRRREASDGRTVGCLLDVLFEDRTWRVRWLLVRPRRTRGAADVLVGPAGLAAPPARRGALALAVALVACPPAEADLPVSRRRGRWPPDPPPGLEVCRCPSPSGPLQSGREMTGYAALRGDEAVGRVRDLIVDEAAWTVSALVIGPGAFRRGRAVAVGEVRRIDWEDGTMRLCLGGPAGGLGAGPAEGRRLATPSR